jgi:hypothetical protein
LYQTERAIGWEWQAVDSKMAPAPLGGQETGRNPTDCGKQGSKIHLLVDERGAPLALDVTGANEHDKWSAGELLVSIVVDRLDPEQTEQHLCADKGYDYEDVHQECGLHPESSPFRLSAMSRNRRSPSAGVRDWHGMVWKR